MIRKAVLLCNIFKTRLCVREACRRFMACFDPAEEKCTVCGLQGECRIHGYYRRRLKQDRDSEEPDVHELRILRVRCMGCRHTHSVLPDLMVPYRRYGLLFIVGVLAEYYHHRISAEKLCERRGISLKSFYRWKEIFVRHLKLWMEARELALSPMRAMQLAGKTFSRFNAQFYEETAFSFLQGHKNMLKEAYRQNLCPETAFFC